MTINLDDSPLDIRNSIASHFPPYNSRGDKGEVTLEKTAVGAHSTYRGNKGEF